MPDLVTDQSTMLTVAVLAYLIGSIPFGLLVARLMGLGDLREIGSGNIGATNVLRTGNKAAAALTLVLDAGKAVVAVIAAREFVGEDAAQLAALAAFLGHLYPIWLGFKGGKGVATFLGALLALNPFLGLAACATWLVVALVMRMSSYAALATAATAPGWALFVDYLHGLLLLTILAVFIFIRHGDNIKRIKSGTEPKIGQKK